MTDKERDEWLAQRKHSVGASEVASILGVNPFSSAYEVWARKCGLIPTDSPESELQYWGQTLEPVIANEYAKRTGNKIVDHGRHHTVKHPKLERLSCTLDREIVTAENRTTPGALECKNTGKHFQEEWGSGAPIYYQVQLQVQLEVMGWDWGVLAALIGGNHYMHIEAERDREIGEMILDRISDFWRLVEREEPPEVDDSNSTREVVKLLYPNDNHETIQLGEEAIALREEFEEAKARFAQAKKDKEYAQTKICALLGENTYGEIPGGGRFSWKKQFRAAYQVDDTSFRVLRCHKK